jgi:hypothetical protein
MAVDIVINETIDVVDITVNPNIIEVNVTRTSGGGGGSQTLAQTLDNGNQTGGENILVNNADAIELENTSLLKKGTYDFGGDGGISRICSNQYEDMWQNGFRHVFDQSGFIRNSSNGFDLVPDETFDVTLRFKVGSFWTLDNGTTYICTDATEGAAVWEIYHNFIPNLTQVLTVGDKEFQQIDGDRDFELSDRLKYSLITGGMTMTLDDDLELFPSNSLIQFFVANDTLPATATLNISAGTQCFYLLETITTLTLNVGDFCELKKAGSGNFWILNVSNTGSGTIPTLQQVTDEGNTTDNNIIVSKENGTPYIQVVSNNNVLTLQVDEVNGTYIELNDADNDNYGYLTCGELFMTSGSSTENVQLNSNYLLIQNSNSKPLIELSGSDFTLTGSVQIKTDLIDGDYTQQLPDKSGTFAMLDDIPTTTSQLTNDGADGVNPFITALDIPVAGEASTLVREVKNMTGATLTKGTVVFISGANGNKALVSKAIATTDALSARTFGLLQSDILNNGLGNCVIIGDLSGINTSSFAEGAQLYLSGTVAGAFTDVRALAPTHLVYVGKVTRSHPTQGQIEVQIQNGYELAEIHDCQIVTPLNNQALVYETSSELWKNKTIIQDSITNGVTTVAPSQNAVFDALVNKKSIVIKDNVLSSIITLTSATEVLVKTYTIPAGTFVDGDLFSFILSAIKTGATQALNIRVKVNTVNNFATASQIALYTVTPFASTSIGVKRERIYFSGTNLTGANATISLNTDISINTATNFSIALNPANEFFVFISLAGAAFTSDTGAINYFQITN